MLHFGTTPVAFLDKSNVIYVWLHFLSQPNHFFCVNQLSWDDLVKPYEILATQSNTKSDINIKGSILVLKKVAVYAPRLQGKPTLEMQ